MKKKHLLSIRGLSSDEIREFLVEAFAIKASPSKFAGALEGQALALIFEKPSLRTRVTFDVAIHQMGGFSIYLSPADVHLGKRECICDVARNLERMVQGIVIRTFAQELVEKMAEHARIPVINGLTDFSHPCQALADYMTILESKGDLRGLKIAFVGDGNNVAHSLIFGAALLGVHLVVATPPGYEPHPEVVQWARGHSPESGCQIRAIHDPFEAVRGADVVYTDVWTSMGQEGEAKERRLVFRPYQVNEMLFSLADDRAIFMHCLPAHRGEEVTDAVIESSRSVVFGQAENRLHMEKAILLNLMG